MLNSSKIEELVKQLLAEFDPDPNREGLKETPKRVAKYWLEMLEGSKYTNRQIADMYNKCFMDVGTNDLVVERDIPIFSTCEHHIALMYDMKVTVAYIPNGKVIGLSKIARVCEMAAKRLQLQERIGKDIAEILSMILDTNDIAVIITGKHACMTARGVRSRESDTRTATLCGAFKSNSSLRSELYSLIK